jgi:hypothetical protein
MMLKNLAAFAAAASLIAAPAAANPNFADDETGARRSGAVAGVYFAVPFGGERTGRPQAGLRLQMTHDYRDAQAPRARVINADALEFRLVGERQPTLFVGGLPVTGDQARRNGIAGQVSGIVTIAVIAAAVVGGYVIYKAIDDSGEE